MAMVLIRGNQQLVLDWPTWSWSLALARLRGWRPAGTTYNEAWFRRQCASEGLSPDEAEQELEAQLDWWDESYTAGGHELVSAEDAAALADALASALPDLPDHDAASHLTVAGADPEARALAAERPGVPISPVEGLSGWRKAEVRDLIDWLRGGGFEISEE